MGELDASWAVLMTQLMVLFKPLTTTGRGVGCLHWLPTGCGCFSQKASGFDCKCLRLRGMCMGWPCRAKTLNRSPSPLPRFRANKSHSFYSLQLRKRIDGTGEECGGCVRVEVRDGI